MDTVVNFEIEIADSLCIISAMQPSMTWNEICRAFPNEWVVVVDYENKGPVEVDGVVLAHATRKSDFQESPRKIIQRYGRIAVRYTGDLVQESDLPLLWQISHTA